MALNFSLSLGSEKPARYTGGASPRGLLRSLGSLVKRGRGYFSALDNSDDRAPVPSAALRFDGIVDPKSRRDLAGMARWLYDDHPLVSYAVNQIALYSAPVMPLGASADAAANRLYNDYFQRWCYRADYSGRFHFNTLEKLISIALDLDGDMVIHLTGAAGITQLQLIGHGRIQSMDADPNAVDGVILDPTDRVTAYSLKTGGSTYQPLAVSSAFHIYEPGNYESYRGISPLRRGVNDLRDGREIKAFLKIAQKYRAALLATIESEDGTIEEDPWNDGTNPAPDASATAAQRKRSIAEFLGGDIPILGKNQKLTSKEGGLDSKGALEFMDTLAAHFVASLDIPPAFFLDQKLNSPNQRAVIGKAQRRFDARQGTLKTFLRWLWPRVIGHGIATGECPATEGWDRCSFRTPSKFTIDVGREAQQEREDVASGLMSRQNHYGNRGCDWRDETDQIVAEDDYIIARAKELATRHGIPLEVVLSRYGYGPRAGVASVFKQQEAPDSTDEEKKTDNDDEDEKDDQ